ncbi:HAD family hydrolase [Haladaptatus sp. NG-WS-4]
MVSREYDFWLLDLDGTLIDIEQTYVRSVFDSVSDRLGRKFSDYESEVIWHGLGGARDSHLREWGIDPSEFWDAFHSIEDPQRRAECTYLYDDAAFVADLDCPVGLVTHCQEFLTEPVIDALDIRDWFDTVVCCDEQLGWKPDPAPVEHAMADLGVSPSDRGILAGDGANDVGAAWNAGLDAVHVERHDPHRRNQCVLGDYRVNTFDELWSNAGQTFEYTD